MPAFTESARWWERAERVIPLGTQTLSKSPTQFIEGVHPRYLRRGRGAHVWDVDGNEFVDYPMALGPVILGYAEPVVDEAVAAQLRDGITFTLMHPLEVEVAERIVGMCPGVEAVRFGKSGSDVVAGAVRAARALTGRDLVLVAGYHGWHDWYIGSTTRSLGVPEAVQGLVRAVPFNDLAAVEVAFREHGDRIAAIVLEPSGAEVPAEGFLAGVVDLAAERGALSIFDEVITGFRLAPGGARQRYGVQPDLSCYGKALGNGMPISAVGGPWRVMRAFEDIFFSGTHGGEALSLAAARAVLDVLADGTVLAGIRARGEKLQAGMLDLVQRHGAGGWVTVGGEPERTIIGFPDDADMVRRSWVQQCMGERGVLFNGAMFICARHDDDDVERALAAFDVALDGVDPDQLAPRLRGPAVQPVFRPA